MQKPQAGPRNQRQKIRHLERLKAETLRLQRDNSALEVELSAAKGLVKRLQQQDGVDGSGRGGVGLLGSGTADRRRSTMGSGVSTTTSGGRRRGSVASSLGSGSVRTPLKELLWAATAGAGSGDGDGSSRSGSSSNGISNDTASASGNASGSGGSEGIFSSALYLHHQQQRAGAEKGPKQPKRAPLADKENVGPNQQIDSDGPATAKPAAGGGGVLSARKQQLLDQCARGLTERRGV